MTNQLGMFIPAAAPRPYTVSEINSRVRALLEREPFLQDIWVEGEISNFSRATSGQSYFTWKDAGSQLNCVMWRTQAQKIARLPQSGDKVVVHGQLGVYEQGGRYQLYVDHVQPAGRGTLQQEFERLKARLEAEGLFAATRKRPLPAYPQCIGIVTSAGAAAFRDVLNVLSRRYPLATVLLAPTLVQGDTAPPQIVAALTALNAHSNVDVILVVRGGGSLEDLWAFNDERVVRAVAASRVPVISGVGHETDFSLCDFAADLRAPTPSAAAELATPDGAELRAAIVQQRQRLARALTAHLQSRRRQITTFTRALRHLAPAVRLANARQRVDDLHARAAQAFVYRRERAQQQVSALRARLTALDPTAVLTRGYAIIRAQDTGVVLTSARQMPPGTALTLCLRDGTIAARTEEAKSGERE